MASLVSWAGNKGLDLVKWGTGYSNIKNIGKIVTEQKFDKILVSPEVSVLAPRPISMSDIGKRCSRSLQEIGKAAGKATFISLNALGVASKIGKSLEVWTKPGLMRNLSEVTLDLTQVAVQTSLKGASIALQCSKGLLQNTYSGLQWTAGKIAEHPKAAELALAVGGTVFLVRGAYKDFAAMDERVDEELNRGATVFIIKRELTLREKADLAAKGFGKLLGAGLIVAFEVGRYMPSCPAA